MIVAVFFCLSGYWLFACRERGFLADSAYLQRADIIMRAIAQSRTKCPDREVIFLRFFFIPADAGD